MNFLFRVFQQRFPVQGCRVYRFLQRLFYLVLGRQRASRLIYLWPHPLRPACLDTPLLGTAPAILVAIRSDLCYRLFSAHPVDCADPGVLIRVLATVRAMDPLNFEDRRPLFNALFPYLFEQDYAMCLCLLEYLYQHEVVDYSEEPHLSNLLDGPWLEETRMAGLCGPLD